MNVQPIADRIGRVTVFIAVAVTIEQIEGFIDRGFDGSTKEIFLVFEIVIDHGAVYFCGTANIFDRHRCVMALGKKIQRDPGEILGARPRHGGRSPAKLQFVSSRLLPASHCHFAHRKL